MAEQRQLLRVTAKLIGAICAPNGSIHLDSLLAWVVARREGLPPLLEVQDIVPIAIPVELEPGGRFHLCSCSIWDAEVSEVRWTNRRPPIAQMQTIGARKLRSVQLNKGANKADRFPRSVDYVKDDEITWFVVGEHLAILNLLSDVTHLGKRRGVGWGRVRHWSAEPCDGWDGAPVLRDGLPLRPLPLDWPGLAPAARTRPCTLTYPYWDHSREELLAVP